MAIFKAKSTVPNRINTSEAGAEAGPGANVAIEDEKADADAPSHGSSTDSPPRSPEGDKGLQPERGRAKIAIIMFALGVYLLSSSKMMKQHANCFIDGCLPGCY